MGVEDGKGSRLAPSAPVSRLGSRPAPASTPVAFPALDAEPELDCVFDPALCTEVESDCLLDPGPSLSLFGEACPLLLPLLSLFDEVVDGGDCTGSRLAPSDPSLAAEHVIDGAALIGTRSLTSTGTFSPFGLTSTGSRPARHSKVKPSSIRRPSESTDGESSKTKACLLYTSPSPRD